MNQKTQHDSETPAQGQQVFTACGFIYRVRDSEIELFIAKRAMTKKFLPGVYELPGGHIDFGEDMQVGLKREIQEEFEVEIKVGECFEVFTYTNHVKMSQSLEAIYFAEFVDENPKVILQPDDHESYIWVKENEIQKIISPEKGEDDDEIRVIKKGFSILKGNFNWEI